MKKCNKISSEIEDPFLFGQHMLREIIIWKTPSVTSVKLFVFAEIFLLNLKQQYVSAEKYIANMLDRSQYIDAKFRDRTKEKN